MNETFGYCTSLCKQNKTEVIGCILVVPHHKGVKGAKAEFRFTGHTAKFRK